MTSLVRTFALGLLAGTVLAPAAFASTFGAAELSQDNALLNQFNLVTLGNYSQGASPTSATIQGRALVGGNATFTSGASSVCTTGCGGNTTAAVDSSGASYGALTVFGNVMAPSGTNPITYLGVGTGSVDVKGTSSGNYLMNTNGSGASGAFNIAGSAQGSTNVGNATAINTTQSSFNGSSYSYNPSTGALGYGVTPQVNQPVASVFPFTSAYQTEVNNLSQGIAKLPGTPGVTAQSLPSGNATFFTANADYTATISGTTYKYGVVTTTMANLASETNFGGINNGSNNATFVIVTGDGANYTLPNLNSYAGSSNVIFDFVNATTLKFAGNWNGTILAPLATITQQGGTFNGSVVVASMIQSNALSDGGLFNGNLSGLVGLTSVPEPASMALLGVGALAAGAAARRRRR